MGPLASAEFLTSIYELSLGRTEQNMPRLCLVSDPTVPDRTKACDSGPGELRSEAEPEVLNDAIFGALYYRLLLRSGPLTGRFEDLVEQVIRGHRSEPT